MERKEIEESVIEIIRNIVEENKKTVGLDTKMSDLGFDSIDKSDALMRIEDKFNMRFPSEVCDTITDVRKITDYIANPREYCKKYKIS